MQINMPDSGTFLFISDHCHVIENVSSPVLAVERLTLYSGAMESLKVGLQEIIQLGSRARSV
jgi:hypothetical protein